MIYSLLAPPRYYAILGAVVLVSFVTGWIMLSQSANSDADAQRQVVWKLPEESDDSILEDIDFLKGKGFFGEGSAEIPEDVDDVALDKGWRALGIVVDHDINKLLINNNSGEVQTLKEGDLIPDGRVVIKIEKDMFTVSKDGEAEDIRLFPMTKEEIREEIMPPPVEADDVLEKTDPMGPTEKTQMRKPMGGSAGMDDEFDDEPDSDIESLLPKSDPDARLMPQDSMRAPQDVMRTPPPLPKNFFEDTDDNDEDLF